MLILSIDKFLDLMSVNHYDIFHEEKFKPYNLNIIGLRNRFGRPNYFDDTIAVYYQEEGKWVSKFYEATTLPGKDSLLKPENPDGAAILVPGQYKSTYKIGLHKGKYDALVQSDEVEVYRDNNKDLVYDADKRTVQKGFFGINIHRASFGAKLVGPDSAGCQVIKDVIDFQGFMLLCNKARGFWGNKFSYTLLEI